MTVLIVMGAVLAADEAWPLLEESGREENPITVEIGGTPDKIVRQIKEKLG